jgi:hypothetical protein
MHLTALVATAVVFVAGADCPLTVWQKACIRRSGSTPYEGGFIEHHFIEPLTGGVTAMTTLGTVAAWAVPRRGATPRCGGAAAAWPVARWRETARQRRSRSLIPGQSPRLR